MHRRNIPSLLGIAVAAALLEIGGVRAATAGRPALALRRFARAGRMHRFARRQVAAIEQVLGPA